MLWNGHGTNNVGRIMIGRPELKGWVQHTSNKSQNGALFHHNDTPLCVPFAPPCLALSTPVESSGPFYFFDDNDGRVVVYTRNGSTRGARRQL